MTVQTNKKTERERKDERSESASLDRRYGKIGIPAVAAALRYAAPAKRSAPEAGSRIEDRFIELAA